MDSLTAMRNKDRSEIGHFDNPVTKNLREDAVGRGSVLQDIVDILHGSDQRRGL